MINPDLLGCPQCHTLKFDLIFKKREMTDEIGNVSYTGYKACMCGALTYSPSSCTLNLRNSVAEEYGIKKIQPKTITSAVPPKIRRSA